MKRPYLILLVTLPPLVLLVAFYALAAWPTSTIYGPVIAHGTRTDRAVALTFDDGLNSGATGAILDVLRQEGVKATFFMTGRNVLASPDLARRVVAEGHLAANHAYNHRKRDALLDFSYQDAARTQDVIERATGVRPAFYRPPNGFHTPWSLRAVRAQGLRTVVWDVDPYDWKDPPPEELMRRVLADVRPGSIILLHDGRDTDQGVDRGATVAALPGIIRGLREQGYRLVTVAEMFALPEYQGWEEAHRLLPGLEVSLPGVLSRRPSGK